MPAFFCQTAGGHSDEYANLARAVFLRVEPSKKHEGKFVVLATYPDRTYPVAPPFDTREAARRHLRELILLVNGVGQ